MLLLVLGMCFHDVSRANACGAQTPVSTQIVYCTNSVSISAFDVTSSGEINSSGNAVSNDPGGSITTFTNAGSINGTTYGVKNNSGATIGVLTNTGTITGGAAGVFNAGVITTINNQQGASGSALTYTGILPVNYNIIINSPSDFGRLSVTTPSGSTIFGINAGSTVANGTYSSVLSGLTISHLSVTSGTYGAGTWTLLNSSGSLWDLVLSGFTLPSTDIGPGDTVALSSVGTTANPVLSGGSLTTLNGEASSLAFSVPVTSTIIAPTTGVATLSGVFSGSGGLTFTGTGTMVMLGANTYSGGTTVAAGTLQGNTSSLQGAIVNNSQVVFDQNTDGTYSGVMSGSGTLTKQGAGTLILTGANTYSGGTTVTAGTLSITGQSPTGTGDVFIGPDATLMGRGVITGRLTVAGTLNPGNSPGFLSTTSTFTMNTGSTYLQDIAGTTQASSTSPVGASGYYSFLNVTNGQFVIQPGATLTPQLSNLFSVGQSGYGSAIYVPALGDRFRMITASGGISGRFSTLTQPAELAAGTQFLAFYNMAGSNSLELAVIPSSYVNTIAAVSGNANAQSVGGVLTHSAQHSLAGTATEAQQQLLYSISQLTNAQSIVNAAQSLAGEVYAATVAIIAQTTQRSQQAVLNRLGDTPSLTTAEAKTFSNANVWGDLAYQRGNRSSDSQSGGWNSNLYQLTFGSDLYSSHGTTLGAGFALSSTAVNPVYGSATIQQASLFAYGKMPVERFVVDAMASIGLSSSDIMRGDLTGLSSGFRNKTVSGNDALISLGLSRPFDLDSVRVTPYARVTWQMVTQSGVNEGDAASALSVDRYTGNGVRGVIGLAAGSQANNPMTAKHTYRAYVGLGVDSSGLLNPTLNASLAGMNTNINTPNAGTTFVQAGLYGTAKLSENTFAYAGISGEARSGQTLGTVNVGLRVQF